MDYHKYKRLKKCTGCGIQLTSENCYKKSRFKKRTNGTIYSWIGYYAKCKKCIDIINTKSKFKYREQQKQYRENNKERISLQKKVHYVKKTQLWIDIIKTIKKLECEKCGYNKNYAALDFHHIKRTNKKDYIHSIMRRNLLPTKSAIKMMSNELNKCQVLCSNCHREFHSKYKYNIL